MRKDDRANATRRRTHWAAAAGMSIGVVVLIIMIGGFVLRLIAQ